MKRLTSFLFLAVIVLMFSSCGTTDHGAYKVDNVPEADRAILYITQNVSIALFDKEQVIWTSGFGDMHKVTVSSGSHQLGVLYYQSNGNVVTSSNMVTIDCTFSPGKTYLLYPEVDNNSVKFEYKEYEPRK